MEQLIRELNDPRNQSSPDRINYIQRQIQLLQRERSAWQLGLDLLQHDDALMRFYGALTLTIKINADWDTDKIGEDENMKNYLLEALVSSYLRLTGLPDANFVLRKLCSTLATLFGKPNSGWALPLRHICASMLSGHYVPQSNNPPMDALLRAAPPVSFHQIKGVVMVAAIIAEDLGSRSSSSAEEQQLRMRLAGNCDDAWQLFSFCLAGFCERFLDHDGRTNGSRSKHALGALQEEQYSEVIKLVMQAMPVWSGLLKARVSDMGDSMAQTTQDRAMGCVAATMKCVNHDDLSSAALHVLTLLLQSSPRLLQSADTHFPHNVVTSPKAEEWMSCLLEGDFSPDAVLYVDFLEAIISQVDVTSPDYLQSGKYHDVILHLQRLLRCRGVAVVEDVVCQIVLETVSQMVEGHTDWAEDQPVDPVFQNLVADACGACLIKIRLPYEQMSSETQTWDSDDRAKFQDFRYDAQDFFQSAFAVLGVSLIEEIAKAILNPSASPDWCTFEAGIFSLTAFSDTMANQPETYDPLISTILSSPSWNEVVLSSSRVPDRARQTSIKFISENTGYFQRHASSLVPVLNFLFSSLHLHVSAGAASRAIYTLCDAQRSSLTEALPQFLSSLRTISDLGETERHRMYGAVAAVIQATPGEEAKLLPLRQILDAVQGLFRAPQDVASGAEELLIICTDVMQTLAAVGKGLRAPADVPIDLEPREDEQSSFWTSGPGQDIQRQALGIYTAAFDALDGRVDSDFVEAACDFIRSGLTEDHPSPFKFPLSTGLELISHQISTDSPNIDAVMACASSFLASVSPKELDGRLAELLYPVANNQQKIVAEVHISHKLPSTDFPSSSFDFLARLLPKWGQTWFTLPDSRDVAGVAVELGLIVLGDPDTLPRRSAASFFVALVECSGANSSLNETAGTNLAAVMALYGARILALVLRLLGGECARSELEAITEPLKRFVTKQYMLTKSVLGEAVKDGSGVLTEKAMRATTQEQRNRFVAQIEGLRGARKTNEVVKDFWIACRGSEFGYIA